jgi:SAM-dependent methyltransferase
MLRSICNGKRVLDVACGDGYGAYLLAQWGAANVTAIDISSDAIAAARARYRAQNVTYQEGDVCRLEELVPPNCRFDLICSFETIEHLVDPKAFLASLGRVRAVGGSIAISAPNDHILPEGVTNPYHLHRFDFTSLRAITEEALGPASAWMFGAPFQGFLLAPERGFRALAGHDIGNALRLKKYGELELIPPRQGQSLSAENVRFWIGVWGGPEFAAAVAAPQSMTSWQEPWRALDYFKQRETYFKQRETYFEKRLAEIPVLQSKLAEERRLGLIARTQVDELTARGTKLSNETMRAMAAEVWRERRRRRLPSKMLREIRRWFKRKRG